MHRRSPYAEPQRASNSRGRKPSSALSVAVPQDEPQTVNVHASAFRWEVAVNRIPDSALFLVPGSSLIAASQVQAIEFSTIAAANDYWRASTIAG